MNNSSSSHITRQIFPALWNSLRYTWAKCWNQQFRNTKKTSNIMFQIFFLLFCRVQSTSISEADVCCVRLKERNWEGVFNFKSWNFFFLVLWYQNMMGIVVLTDLYKVLLIKSIISNHVNPLYSWSTYINTDKNNPENKEEDTDNPLIKWKTGQIKQSHSPQTESFCQSFDITQCLQPT